ncbi:EamA family transporter [Actinomadura terrae]|uniref:EamA family transporter n=1 Tax=Actinomadura terrae TaxID=604353 RepID=UPI001FA6D053|nr:EamA family transporter [Actinomadura terrae]
MTNGMPARWAGVATMLASGASNQTGAAVGALAFPVIGPAGVVAVRQWVAAAVLLSVGRPRLRTFTGGRWWPVLALAAVFATMNLSLYTAVDRVGLGLAVTLEFLGPLAVALAGTRRRVDLGCALAAAGGVVTLTRPQPTSDFLGLGLALLAACCWASYILLNRSIGRSLPGAEGSAAAAGLSGLLFVPIGVVALVHHPPTARALACAGTAGVLSSAVPFLADLLALRRVPARLFGVFMSVNPVLAAAAGLLVLGETLGWTQWLGILAIVTANAVTLVTRPAEQGSPPRRASRAGRAATPGRRATPGGG